MKLLTLILSVVLLLISSPPFYAQSNAHQNNPLAEAEYFPPMTVQFQHLLEEQLSLYLKLYQSGNWRRLYPLLSRDTRSEITRKRFISRKRWLQIDTYVTIPATHTHNHLWKPVFEPAMNVRSIEFSGKTLNVIAGYRFEDFKVKQVIETDNGNEDERFWGLYGCMTLHKAGRTVVVNGGVDAYLEGGHWYFSDISVDVKKKKLVSCSY